VEDAVLTFLVVRHGIHWRVRGFGIVVAAFSAIGSVVERSPAAWESDTLHWNSLPRLSTIYVEDDPAVIALCT
jgi:hypothetical protein